MWRGKWRCSESEAEGSGKREPKGESEHMEEGEGEDEGKRKAVEDTLAQALSKVCFRPRAGTATVDGAEFLPEWLVDDYYNILQEEYKAQLTVGWAAEEEPWADAHHQNSTGALSAVQILNTTSEDLHAEANVTTLKAEYQYQRTVLLAKWKVGEEVTADG